MTLEQFSKLGENSFHKAVLIFNFWDFCIVLCTISDEICFEQLYFHGMIKRNKVGIDGVIKFVKLEQVIEGKISPDPIRI